MIKKIFLLSLTIILFCQVALAKEKEVEIPLEDRVKIFVEVEDITNFVELETDLRLREMLTTNLASQKIFNVINSAENNFDFRSLGDKKSMADVGELIIFQPTKDTPFDAESYKNLGADYVLRCKILGIGAEQVIESYGYNRPSIGIGIGIGSGRHSRWGIGIGTGIDVGGSRKRNFYSVVVQVQLISVAAEKTLWRQNIIGQINLGKKPSKGYDDANDEAYFKALREVTKNISKHVTDYSKKFLIQNEKIADKKFDDKKLDK